MSILNNRDYEIGREIIDAACIALRRYGRAGSITISSILLSHLPLVFHGTNEERRAGGASPLWKAGVAAWAQIGTCLPWERGTNPRAAGQRQSKSRGYRKADAGTRVSVGSAGPLGSLS